MIFFFASVGGITDADLIAGAIENEASDAGNERKLQKPPNASRRHLVIVFNVSSGSFFNAAQRGRTGVSIETAPTRQGR
jgi:hypothetical protein